MPRPTPLVALLLVAGLRYEVPGTPAADPAPAPTEGPGSDPVTWADRLCGSILTFIRPILVEPDYGAAPDLRTVQQAKVDAAD